MPSEQPAEERKSPIETVLSVFADVRPGEGVTALLLALNVFLLLGSYYLLKTVREPLILTESGAELKSYAAAGQALLLLFLIPAYGSFAAKVDRLRLIRWVTLFFIWHLAILHVLGVAGVHIGVAFFLWVGIFNILVIAQFWAFATDSKVRSFMQRSAVSKLRYGVLLLLALVFAGSRSILPAQLPDNASSSLRQLSDSFEVLAQRAAPAVVQIITSGYGPVRGIDPSTATRSKQRSGGSGVILDPNGYIITNAHVVEGARRVQVLLASRRSTESEPQSILRPRAKLRDARIVGLDDETDLAVLRIDEVDLPYLELGDSDTVRQGQLVFAFGSPLGLDNSVTMGVVSSAARQLQPDHPMIYIQTDTAINPGNSGGPLLNAEGEVIGINTLIFTQSGGNEGVGFAAPSNIVRTVYRQIRENGTVLRGEIGVVAQTITPLLAEGLGLRRDWGVVLSDVRPGGPAAIADLEIGDIVLSLNGKQMENGRQFRVNVYQRSIGDLVKLEILRGDETRRVSVAVLERENDPTRFAALANRRQNFIPALGLLGIDLTEELRAMLPPLRKSAGVLVAALVADGPYWSALFQPGDVIYSVNARATPGLESLRAVLAGLGPEDAVVVQVERRTELVYVTFQME